MAEPALPSSARIVVVEDDPVQASAITVILRHEGFAVEVAATAAEGLQRVNGVPPADLVLRDVMLPDLRGLEVARRLRAGTDVPIILLTSCRDEVDKVVGLDSDADDYVTKPYSAAELLARIRAHLRRSRRAGGGVSRPSSRFEVGALTIDVGTREVRRADQPIQLTPREFDLLRVLAEAAGRVVDRQQILNGVFGPGFFGDERMLDTYMRRLRKKVEVDPEHPRYLHTVRGVGYRLAELDAPVGTSVVG
ncbi:MAG TPA: response regulator transcription factor [Chloroflexota bacterium]|nr:response regulator transcription factor [Chloroflexota bacterium]